MDETTLVEASKNGDRAAFGLLIDRYYQGIYRLVYHQTASHHDADDLCQQTFLHAMSAIGGLRDSNNFRQWVFTIAVNLLRKGWRKTHMNTVQCMDPHLWEQTNIADLRHDPGAALSTAEKSSVVRQRLHQMPEELRTVAILTLMEGFAQKEAAAVLRRSEATVSRQVRAAKEWLYSRLQDVI